MNLGIVAALAYGILALAGGIIGYMQAKSKISLISGVTSGLLLIIAGILQLQGQAWGLTLAEVVAGVLIVVFILRFVKTRKFMPAGLMIIGGVLTLGAMLYPLFA
ncbi:MAG: hypothetical protein F6K31_17230 [Symploca sp. SIO2G7]|nr:hypothetical protein [Symploca sp. SIO2G7]